MKKVLVLCTGNSCRSIMAEAMVNHFLGEQWIAYSAGVSPSVVNPRAIRVLQEMGINTTGLRSKSMTEFINRDDLDLVITVCDNAREACPLFAKPVSQIHIGIDDPVSHVSTSEEAALGWFRNSRDQIRRLIIERLKQMK